MCEVVFLTHHRVWCDHVHEHMNTALESHIQGLSKEKNKKNKYTSTSLKYTCTDRQINYCISAE